MAGPSHGAYLVPMPKIYRTDQSREDYTRIHDFIAQNSPQNAAMILRAFADKLRLLSRNPDLGLPRPELSSGVRSWIVHNFVLFYRQSDDGIILLRVLHASVDVSSKYLANL